MTGGDEWRCKGGNGVGLESDNFGGVWSGDVTEV